MSLTEHREHCNYVKGILIKTISELFHEKNEKVNLLDLCSGRGGDMFKWNKSNIKRVIGLDNHIKSVNEAINRYKKINKKNFKTKISYFVDDVSICKLNKYYKETLIEIVTCQFALHYFNDLDSLLIRVSDVLKSEGYFIGVCPDGDIIKECILKNKEIDGVVMRYIDEENYDFKLIKDKKSELKTEDYFAYRQNIVDKDCIDNEGFSREYYVHKILLTQLAIKHNFKVCSYTNLGKFLPKSWGGESPISGLYFSFVLQKV